MDPDVTLTIKCTVLFRRADVYVALTSIDTCMNIDRSIHTCLYVYVCVHVGVCAHVCVCESMPISTYRYKETKSRRYRQVKL